MNWLICLVLIIILILVSYLLIQGIRCKSAVKKGKEILKTYDPKDILLSYGNMSYVDKGQGEVILSVHGIFGGYDQAYDTCKDFVSDYRIIAPSRFGYLGSDIKDKGTPSDQAKAYVELLDKLGIDKVYVLSTSAGGSVAIRFALDFPERTKGLILYCSAMPLIEKPNMVPKYVGPPAPFLNNYVMYLMSPLFKPMMGMESSTIYSMLPVSERKKGIIIDSSITNTDMMKNYDSYVIEDLKVSTLVLHSKDDKLASFKDTKKAIKRFPNCTFVSFETGGHLMVGHEKEVNKAVCDFIR